MEWIDHLLAKLRPATLSVNNKSFIDPLYKEVKASPHIDILLVDETMEGPLLLGTIESLSTYLNWLSLSGKTVRVIVTTKGIVTTIYPDTSINPSIEGRRHDHLIVPFRYCQDTLVFTQASFVDFLDQHSGCIDDEESIRGAVRLLKSMSSEEIQTEDRGPFTLIEIKASKGVEGTKGKLPKLLNIKMDTGTREYQLVNTFIIRVDDKLTFTLSKRKDTALTGELIGLVIKDLRKLIKCENFIVTEGAC